jgi:hypothetical protein
MENDSTICQLEEFINSSIHCVPAQIWVRKAQEFYNLYIRPYTEKKLPMRRKMIYTHAFIHAPNCQTMVEVPLREMNNILLIIRDNGLYERESADKPPTYNPFHLSQYLKVLKERRPLLAAVNQFRQKAK